MANNVFANGREIACKSGDGKTIAAFPDVCFTPPDKVPPTPPGIPIPYPVTSKSKDMTGGSKKVKISGKEVMLKSQSHYKKCTGDDAGRAQKKGLITSKINGKVYFTSWSMDVKVEGKNVVRHLDLTTSNHASPPANAACPWPNIDTIAPPTQTPKPCAKKCPKKPGEARAKELRRKSPSSKAREEVNARSPKICAACGGSPSALAADHIVPLKIISQMPGFACLSEENQEKIANTPENYVGLCTSCNSSKSAKLWHRWKGHKPRGLDWTSNEFAETRKKAMETTKKSIVNLKQKIKAMPCG